MGKFLLDPSGVPVVHKKNRSHQHAKDSQNGDDWQCNSQSAPICDCWHGVSSLAPKSKVDQTEFKELVIVGAGPHSLALVLRLLEPDADLLSDKQRHLRADFEEKMRPFSHVRKHVQEIIQGTKAKNLKKKAKKNTIGKQKKNRCTTAESERNPPPVSLEFLQQQTLIIDGSYQHTSHGIKGGWMLNWKQNFDALQIEQLRSPITAHADPFDLRSLQFYADKLGRDDELVPFPFLKKLYGRWDYHGPYNAPSTKLFHSFHDQLIQSYGISDLVQAGYVEDIALQETFADQKPLFQVSIREPSGRIRRVHTPRVVCATGPSHRVQPNFSWMNHLASSAMERILSPKEIIPSLLSADSRLCKPSSVSPKGNLLIVGGGITSAHLALVALQQGWSSVTLIQRSKTMARQFDVNCAWMGPARGKLLDQFLSLSLEERVQRMKEERGGGSISPEILDLLQRSKVNALEEVEIADVQQEHHDGPLEIVLDKVVGESEDSILTCDMIWLSTGFQNSVANDPFLQKILSTLSIDRVGGLPALKHDLSLHSRSLEDNNVKEDLTEVWKERARNNFWILGALAGLELGPDALNLMGARQGSVRVAKRLRLDLCKRDQTA